MPNLNNPLGFAQETLSTASGALNTLLGAIAQSWDIEEGAYGHPESGTNVLFHVFKTASDYDAGVPTVQDTGGRRKVQFKFPYVDGQSTDDLGREGESFDVDIILSGANYKRAYQKLLSEFNNPIPGTLIHPVRGRLQAVAKDWTVTHSNDKVQAVVLRVRFIEHNFNFSLGDVKKTKSVNSVLASAVAFIGAISKIATQVQSNVLVAQNVVNTVNAAVKAYQDLFNSTLLNMNATFNQGSAVLPGLLPTNQNAATFASALSPNDPFASSTVSSTVKSALATQQAVDQVAALRTSLNSTIATIEGTSGGQGALLFYDEIQTLRQSAIAMQSVLETGLQSSKAQIVLYTTPRDMSMREVAFDNGLTLDSVDQLQLLNPAILSHNYLPAGTVLQVPKS